MRTTTRQYLKAIEEIRASLAEIAEAVDDGAASAGHGIGVTEEDVAYAESLERSLRSIADGIYGRDAEEPTE